MAPSLVKALGSAAAVLPALASATLSSSNKSYKISEVYDSSNFFDKFNFVSIPDPTGGYVQYQERSAAEKLGLVRTDGAEMYIGVDHGAESVLDARKDAGRKSVRLESKTVYNRGLVVAEFSHLPRPTCGTWPAFWFFGEPWPTKGEIDLYENWNDLFFNRHTAHVDDPSVVGDCIIAQDEMAAIVDTPNCFDFAQGQANFQGCSASDFSTTFGSSSGGVYAMEWTDEHLKIWQWERALAPVDVKSGNPKPSAAWGLPAYAIKQCNVDKAFRDMKMVLNLDFCGVAAQPEQWGASCSASTKFDTCAEYVAAKPGDFVDTFFKVKDIKFYELSEEEATSSSTTSKENSATSSAISSTSSAISSASSKATSTASSGSTTSDLSVDSTATLSATSSAIPSVTSGSSPSATGSSSTDTFPTDGHSTSSSANSLPPTGYPTQEPPATTEAPGPESTTSTIYATNVRTITSCAADVPNCPEKGQVTTEIISVGVTVCPVTETGTTTGPAQPPKPTTGTTKAPESPGGGTGILSTVSVTHVYTITSCPPTVPDCPVGSITTEIDVKTTTVQPPAGGEYPTHAPGTSKPVVEKPVIETPVPIETPAPIESPIPSETPVPVENPVPNGPGSEEGTTTVECTKTGTLTKTIQSTKTIQVTETIARQISSSSASPSSASPPTTAVPAVPTTFATTSSAEEKVVEVTATIVPIPVSSDIPTDFANTTTTTAQGYPSIALPPPQGTGAFTFPNNPSEGIVEVSAGVRAGASAALMAIAGFFFFAM